MDHRTGPTPAGADVHITECPEGHLSVTITTGPDTTDLRMQVDGHSAIAIPTRVAYAAVAVISDAVWQRDIAPRLTCAEAETLADLLSVCGGSTPLAEELIHEHGQADENDEDHPGGQLTRPVARGLM